MNHIVKKNIVFWILLSCVFLSNAATRTWDGGGTDNNWTTANNWSTNVAPVAGDDIVFAGSTRTTNTNDFTANTIFASITFSDNNAFTITGNAIQISGGASAITANNTANTQTFDLNITFSSSAPTITTTSGGTLALGGTIANGGFLISIVSGGSTTLSGIISGTGGITKSGSGALTLSGANTYSGTYTHTEGDVNVNNNTALGSATTVMNGTGKYILLANVTVNNNLTITAANPASGKGVITGPSSGTATWAGNIAQNSAIINGGLTEGGNTTNGLVMSGTITASGTNIVHRDNKVTYSNTISGYLTFRVTGTAVMGASNIMSSSGILEVGVSSTGTFDLNSYNQSVAGLIRPQSQTSTITTTSGTPTLTLNLSSAQTYPGAITGAVSISKTGTGSQTLSGANTYTGSTTITAGSIILGATNTISASSFILNGGTLTTGATTGFSNTTTGTLSVTETSTIAFGTGAHSLIFAASDGTSWTSGKYIYVTGWQGGYNGSASTGSNPALRTGSSAELSATKLGQIRFINPSNGNYHSATQLASGEIAPTATVVPVDLLDFIAQKISQNQSKLVWSTSQEINNKLFEIQRSNDGINFEKIGEVNGSGSTNNISKYEFNDFSYNDNSIVYYRLKQIDFDGKFEILPIISLFPENVENKNSLTVYPNPVNKGQIFTIKNFNTENYPFTIEVYSIDGKLILTKEYLIQSDKIELNTDNLNVGEYILKVKSNSNILYNKFIVE